jgi:hypothetical protein
LFFLEISQSCSISLKNRRILAISTAVCKSDLCSSSMLLS